MLIHPLGEKKNKKKTVSENKQSIEPEQNSIKNISEKNYGNQATNS